MLEYISEHLGSSPGCSLIAVLNWDSHGIYKILPGRKKNVQPHDIFL